jgi:hypothetical protein
MSKGFPTQAQVSFLAVYSFQTTLGLSAARQGIEQLSKISSSDSLASQPSCHRSILVATARRETCLGLWWLSKCHLPLGQFWFLVAHEVRISRSQTPMAPFDNSASETNGDPNLACTDATWQSIVVFLLANYVAHCATVKAYPGESTGSLVRATFFALLQPVSGTLRAVDSIRRHSRLKGTNDLQRAARAGALCMVVRTSDWKPQAGDVIKGVKIERQPSRRMDAPQEWKLAAPVCLTDKFVRYPHLLTRRGWFEIHGSYQLPEGYGFETAPSDTLLRQISPDDNSRAIHVTICANSNLLKSFVAILQALYAAYTLYHARGKQIAQFGYASYGLTVVPYLIMSILNLVSQLLNPDYPTLFIIRSPEMFEAERRGAFFDGVIGSTVSMEKEPEEWIVEAAGNPPENESAHPSQRSNSIPSRPGSVSSEREQDRSSNISLPTMESETLYLRKRIPGDDSSDPDARSQALQRADILQIYKSSSPADAVVTLPVCSPFASGRIKEFDPHRFFPGTTRRRLPLHFALDLLYSAGFCLLGLLIIGLMTGFKQGGSTPAQRGWIMSWYLVGTFFGGRIDWGAPVPASWSWLFDSQMRKTLTKKQRIMLISIGAGAFVTVYGTLYGILFTAPIGGFVVVVQEMLQWGTCELVG